MTLNCKSDEKFLQNWHNCGGTQKLHNVRSTTQEGLRNLMKHVSCDNDWIKTPEIKTNMTTISNLESNGHLSLTADSEITSDLRRNW